jgi:hypothetical protein
MIPTDLVGSASPPPWGNVEAERCARGSPVADTIGRQASISGRLERNALRPELAGLRPSFDRLVADPERT